MLDAILAAPVIVKVLGALALILVTNTFCKHLILSVAVGAVVLGLWSGHSLPRMGAIAWERSSSTSTLFLMLVIFQVIWLSSQMSATGVMQDLVAAVRARVSQRTSMAVLPAVIGLLPMPGGALFSAPLVESCDTDGAVSPHLKAQANHWFRHVWEYWWPIYPGVLLAMEITGLDVWQFMLLGIPLTLGAIAAGYVFLLRRIAPEHAPSVPRAATGPRAPLLPLVEPILVVITCYTVVRLSHAWSGNAWPMNRYVPMALGLLCAMAVLQLRRPLAAEQWREVICSRRALNMALIVCAVRIYGASIEARLPNGELLVAQMRGEMAGWGVPLVAIMMCVPLLSGLATGVSVGFVGASFPIVLALLGEDPAAGQVFAATLLAMGFGFMGMLLSPVHICLIVSSRHFNTRVLPNAIGMLKPAIAVLAWCLLLHLLVSAVLT